MFIIWGKKSRQEDGGVVADWCNQCGGARYFRLTHFYSVSHVYYIPLGAGTFVATTRQCVQCGTAESCDVQNYARVLSHAEAMGRTIEDVMQSTNPRLDEKLRKQYDFQQEMTARVQGGEIPNIGSPVLNNSADERMLTALNTLSAFDIRREEVSGYLEQLRKWDYLTPSEREVLLREMDAFVKQDSALNAIINFVKLLPTPSPDWIIWTALLGIVVVLIVGFSTVPFVQSWLWGTLFFIATLVVAIIFYVKVTDRRVRSWVNKILLPRAAAAHIDLSLFVSVLASVDTKVEGIEPRISDMATNLETIADELVQRGQLDLPEEPVPSPSDVSLTPDSVPYQTSSESVMR